MMLLLCAAALLSGCAQQTGAEYAAPAPSATPAAALETPAPEGFEAMLTSHTWQDVYDDSFWLEFDLRQGTMTENNRVLESKTTYRITIDKEKSVFLAENGGEKKEIPFRLENEYLTVDFGDPLGEILYQAVDKTP
ncbi:MAG: hypothetical protein E7330_01155 [Clostridiales bacterium]|nr:hypothetical protein [Clostridiales bacterium]